MLLVFGVQALEISWRISAGERSERAVECQRAATGAQLFALERFDDDLIAGVQPGFPEG
jgi:hypothetical protein